MATTFEVRTTIPRLPSGNALRSGLLIGLRRWFQLAQSRARALAPIAGGTLRSQIRARVFFRGDRIIGSLSRGRAFYGAILEKGVPHAWEVKPKHAWALRFSVGGQVIYAMKVRHPGFRARPHFGPTLATGRPELVPQLTRGLEEAFQPKAGEAP
jgi:hypothetical protein